MLDDVFEPTMSLGFADALNEHNKSRALLHRLLPPTTGRFIYNPGKTRKGDTLGTFILIAVPLQCRFAFTRLS